MYKKFSLKNIKKCNCIIQVFKDGELKKESEYDVNGNLIRIYKKGVECLYTYNSNNLPLSLSASTGYREAYEYNSNNLLICKMIKNDNQSPLEYIYYDYDFLNRLISTRNSTGVINNYYYIGSTMAVYKHELLNGHCTEPIFDQQFTYNNGQIVSYNNSTGKEVKIIYKK